MVACRFITCQRLDWLTSQQLKLFASFNFIKSQLYQLQLLADFSSQKPTVPVTVANFNFIKSHLYQLHLLADSTSGKFLQLVDLSEVSLLDLSEVSLLEFFGIQLDRFFEGQLMDFL